MDFSNFIFLTVDRLKRVELRLRAKFGRNRSKRGRDMALFRFFKMAAAAILDFSNFTFLTVGRLKRHSAVICAKTAEPNEMPFGLWTRTGSRNHELDEGPDPPQQGAIFGERVAHRTSIVTFCRELCRNGGTDRFAVWVVETRVGPKEAQVRSYSPGGANVPSHVGTLAQPGEYD